MSNPWWRKVNIRMASGVNIKLKLPYSVDLGITKIQRDFLYKDLRQKKIPVVCNVQMILLPSLVVVILRFSCHYDTKILAFLRIYIQNEPFYSNNSCSFLLQRTPDLVNCFDEIRNYTSSKVTGRKRLRCFYGCQLLVCLELFWTSKNSSVMD